MEKRSEDVKEEVEKSPEEMIARLRRSSRNLQSNDELATLESELRRAYARKELQAQLAEREVERYIESVRRRSATEEVEVEERRAVENALKRRIEAQERSLEYRKQLEVQMSEKREEKRQSKEQERLEREILQDVDRIQEENERSTILQRKYELVESSRRERLIYQEMKEIQKERDQEAEARKLLLDEKYIEDIERRTREMKILREEKATRRECIVEEIAEMIIRAEVRKRERESLVSDLVAEDIRRELLIREKEEKAHRKKMKEELAASLEEQIVFTEECKLRFVEQDHKFAEEIMKKIMEDRRTERLTSEARRRLQLQYRQDLEKLIEERREIREREIEKMENELREERSQEEARKQIVKEERKKLLEQHSLNIGDFIDKTILTAEEKSIVAETKRDN